MVDDVVDASDGAVRWPVVLFDDDGYPYVLQAGDPIESVVEDPMFSDEIVASFDSVGNRLRLHYVDDTPTLTTDGEVELEVLRKFAVGALTRFARLGPDQVEPVDQMSAASIIAVIDATGI